MTSDEPRPPAQESEPAAKTDVEAEVIAEDQEVADVADADDMAVDESDDGEQRAPSR